MKGRTALAAILGMAAGIGVALPSVERVPIPVVRPQVRVSKRQLLRAASGAGVDVGGYLNHGDSTRQSQRKALKAKNRAKHRRACRS